VKITAKDGHVRDWAEPGQRKHKQGKLGVVTGTSGTIVPRTRRMGNRKKTDAYDPPNPDPPIRKRSPGRRKGTSATARETWGVCLAKRKPFASGDQRTHTKRSGQNWPLVVVPRGEGFNPPEPKVSIQPENGGLGVI